MGNGVKNENGFSLGLIRSFDVEKMNEIENIESAQARDTRTIANVLKRLFNTALEKW